MRVSGFTKILSIVHLFNDTFSWSSLGCLLFCFVTFKANVTRKFMVYGVMRRVSGLLKNKATDCLLLMLLGTVNEAI